MRLAIQEDTTKKDPAPKGGEIFNNYRKYPDGLLHHSLTLLTANQFINSRCPNQNINRSDCCWPRTKQGLD